MLSIMQECFLLILFISISAVFAACEVAFLSISNIRLHSFLEKKLPNSESLSRLRHNKRRVIISLLIGSNILNIAASAFATSISISLFGEAGLGIAVGIMSFLLLTFGDIAPKSYATTYGDKIALAFSPLMEYFYYLSLPLVLVFEFINHLIPGVYSRATGIERFSEEEVRSAVRLGAKHQSISEKERELIENILNFNDRSVADSMTAAGNVLALEHKMSVKSAYKLALESNFSRFPILEGKKPVGTVHLKTICRALETNPEQQIGQVGYPPVLLGLHEKANIAFLRLQSLGRNIGVVIDQKGDFVGIITLEDLLEEIVGEIK